MALNGATLQQQLTVNNTGAEPKNVCYHMYSTNWKLQTLCWNCIYAISV